MRPEMIEKEMNPGQQDGRQESYRCEIPSIITCLGSISLYKII